VEESEAIAGGPIMKPTSYVIARENNVLRVNFERSTDPPNPQFPGAGALRSACGYQVDDASRRPWFRKEKAQAQTLGR
jgi:hypothetical protein